MVRPVRHVLSLTALLATLLITSACQRRGRDDGAAAPGSARARTSGATTTLTGTLQSGAVAIGGETTGWRLVGDGQTGGFDLDVSKVRTRAKQLVGRRVTVTGRMTTRAFVERGQTQVLVAEKIEPAPEARR